MDTWSALASGFKQLLLGRRSVVKIAHTGSCGVTSDGSEAKAWVVGSAPVDCRITKYIQLPSTSDSITAMAIDGADNLWVRSELHLTRWK